MGGGKGLDVNVARNCLKAYVYLLTWFLGDNSKLKETKEMRTKTKKKTGRPTSTTNNQAALLNEIKMHQIKTLEYLKDILEMDLQMLWYEQKIEEDFVKVFVKTCFDMFENQHNTKSAEIKELLFQIMQITMERFGGQIKYMQSQNSTNIINLLYNQENMAPHMAEFVGLVAEKQGNQMPNEIIKELTK